MGGPGAARGDGNLHWNGRALGPVWQFVAAVRFGAAQSGLCEWNGAMPQFCLHALVSLDRAQGSSSLPHFVLDLFSEAPNIDRRFVALVRVPRLQCTIKCTQNSAASLRCFPLRGREGVKYRPE